MLPHAISNPSFVCSVQPEQTCEDNYLWDEAHVHAAEVFPFHTELELSEGFHKGHALDVTDGATKLKGTIQNMNQNLPKMCNNIINLA